LDDEIKKDEMCQACAFMGEIKNYTEFWSESLKGRDHSEDLSIGGG
jgi:hypothetical protein